MLFLKHKYQASIAPLCLKLRLQAECWWLVPVISNMWEAGGSWFEASLGKKISQDLHLNK
jgi:hypothetical protein